ncbi:uncharacterized protein LOC134817069 isoform X6 [Bolinopsis microptera]|uniref:uncharacterized protein LOC134817069 isoform X6 n=1 Tax=Bolinopsis microptera TaxID=2820187 RepID=UPI003078C691
MFHANLKIKKYKKPKRKSNHSGSFNETPVQKDDEFLGNLLRRSEVPRFSVTGDPFDLDEADYELYNKLKPDDPDKVVDIESQDEQVGYEFSTTQIKEFRKVFNAFDRDGNDSIGTEELGPVLNALGYSPSDLDIQKVLSRFDADHSGDLSFEEYLALMAVWVEEDETQIIEAFKVFDKSGDGFVTITELKRALCRFGEKFSEEEADEFFALIDVNKDGIINYEEFVKYMLSEINRGPPPRQVKT